VSAGDPASSGRERAIGRLTIRDQRMYVVVVTTFLLATAAISLYDAYLLLSLMAG
jgi:hypothetical protein